MTEAEQAAAYRFLRCMWPGLLSQLRMASDDEPADRVYVVRMGLAERLQVQNDTDSFDAAVQLFMAEHVIVPPAVLPPAESLDDA